MFNVYPQSKNIMEVLWAGKLKMNVLKNQTELIRMIIPLDKKNIILGFQKIYLSII